MSKEVMKPGGKKKSSFIHKVMEILPDGGNLNLCLTCGACSSGCPATGLEDIVLPAVTTVMRKFMNSVNITAPAMG
jgi:heterodisulfide reductase subunit C